MKWQTQNQPPESSERLKTFLFLFYIPLGLLTYILAELLRLCWMQPLAKWVVETTDNVGDLLA